MCEGKCSTSESMTWSKNQTEFAKKAFLGATDHIEECPCLGFGFKPYSQCCFDDIMII